MELSQIIVGIIVSLISIFLFIYISFTAHCKGPIFSNTYLWLSKEERKKVDKRSEYKLVTLIFGCLAIIFALLSIYIFTRWAWSYVLMWALIVFVIIFAIVNSVKTERKKK